MVEEIPVNPQTPSCVRRFVLDLKTTKLSLQIWQDEELGDWIWLGGEGFRLNVGKPDSAESHGGKKICVFITDKSKEAMVVKS